MCHFRHIWNGRQRCAGVMSARLFPADAIGHYDSMITFDEFVRSIGPNAMRYSPAQLRQLHIDVRKIAQILIAIRKARLAEVLSSPQPLLDDSSTDRTLEETLTESDAGT